VPRFVSRGFGRVINIASNAGLTGYAYTSAYTAAKHALVGLTRAVAMEVATRGDVTVNALCPGFLDTEMTQASIQRIVEKTHRSAEEARDSLARSSPQRRLIAPAEVAHAVVFLCSPLARGIHGQALPIDGGQVMK
jgi:3-hydroxybutyrate dehydrogenase